MKKLLFIFIFLTFAFIFPLKTNASSPVKILLVPGHDSEVWGAQFSKVKEAAMNLAVASRIYNTLSKDKRFEVHITRDTDGYTKEFADYFKDHEADIRTFRDNAKLLWKENITSGVFIERENVPHITVNENTSIILYGINKWASENKMDAVIHIHFNDYPREKSWTIGKYTGFAIYIPDGQLANWFASGQLSADVYTQLSKKYHTSTYQKELGGMIPDQKLISLGANGTLNASVRSMLIEYSYIYEKRLRNYTTRHQAYADMAKLTVHGIKNYFFPK